MSKTHRESKICKNCGHPFENRKRWSSRDQWEQVVFCSKRCRSEYDRNQK